MSRVYDESTIIEILDKYYDGYELGKLIKKYDINQVTLDRWLDSKKYEHVKRRHLDLVIASKI